VTHWSSRILPNNAEKWACPNNPDILVVISFLANEAVFCIIRGPN